MFETSEKIKSSSRVTESDLSTDFYRDGKIATIWNPMLYKNFLIFTGDISEYNFFTKRFIEQNTASAFTHILDYTGEGIKDFNLSYIAEDCYKSYETSKRDVLKDLNEIYNLMTATKKECDDRRILSPNNASYDVFILNLRRQDIEKIFSSEESKQKFLNLIEESSIYRYPIIILMEKPWNVFKDRDFLDRFEYKLFLGEENSEFCENIYEDLGVSFFNHRRKIIGRGVMKDKEWLSYIHREIIEDSDFVKEEKNYYKANRERYSDFLEELRK